ncbi:hypothetical protein Tco_0907158, partial [Tanacetum coccineum]
DKYVAEILKKFNLVSKKTAITPMEAKVALTKDKEAVDVDVTPKTSHLNAVKRIFKYLKGKPNLGLWYPRESPFDLEAFSDSDYVATSTTEAEYVAAANCCGQVLWVQNQLLDYGFNFMNTKIHIDNESTICIVKNPMYHSKTKHIEIRHHFIRDCYEKKLISVEKILCVPPQVCFNFLSYYLNDSLVKQFWQTATAKTLADGTLELPRIYYVKSAFEEVNTGGIKVSAGIKEINAGSLDVNTGSNPVTTDSIRVSVHSPDKGRREGKAHVTEEEETQASKKTKEQILLEEAGLAEAIRAKLGANAGLKESVLGKDLTVEDYAKRMVDNKGKSLKRFGEELQTKTAKKLKFDDEGDESEDSDEANEKDDSTSGTKIPINPVPVATKSPSIANYKIIKQGRKGVYQIVRENGTDMVYISFGAMLTDISRDDLTELYRIVMKKHGMNEPEDEFEKVLWEYLKNMFEEPLSTDSIWSLPGQQRIICWRYYDACRVHCLNLESADVYMLIERKYPLSAEVCKAMLDKKLQGGKPDEDCYKLLKMMEKQAVEMVFSQPWTCTFLVAKGLTTPELMANWKIIMLQLKNNSKDNAHKILKKLVMKTLKET